MPHALSRQRLLALEAMNQVGSWEMDLDSGELWWSDLTHTLHETDPKNFRLTFSEWLRFFPTALRAEPRDAMVRLLTAGAPFALVLPLVRAAGGRRWLRIAAAAGSQGADESMVFGGLIGRSRRSSRR